MSQKSIGMAYFLWLFGGIFGVHLFYLKRDRQAFLWWSTLGGYIGIGWFLDIFNIPRMVREANDHPDFIEGFKQRVRMHKKPPFSGLKFFSAIMIAYLWAQLVIIAVPEDDLFGVSWQYTHWAVPLAIALAIWNVGNIGVERGSIWPCLLAAYAVYPLRYVFYDETYWLSIAIVVPALVFDHFSKEWKLNRPKPKSFTRRVFTLTVCGMIYLSVVSGYFYFNGKITDSEGDTVPLHEAIKNAFMSPLWKDLKQSLKDTWSHARHNGFYSTWKSIIDALDADGEQNAYKVLGISPTASQSEIKAVYRKLSIENHPDKVKGTEKEKREAQERFMQISQAYETLSKIKSRRRNKNKRSDREERWAEDNTNEF